MVVTLRWRMDRRSVWKPATNFGSCLGFRRDRILRFAWVSIKLTSISAMASSVFVVYLLGIWDHVYCGYTKNCANGGCRNLQVVASSSINGPTPGCGSWSFWASRDCKRCSSSFTNSMAPPTMEAWSPYKNKCFSLKGLMKTCGIWFIKIIWWYWWWRKWRN